MATPDSNLADRTGGLVESHKGYDPRILFFYFLIAALLLTLAGGLGYQQLSKTGEHSNAERQQNQRRILVPGPRGNIYDRNQKLLVGNNHRFSVLLHLDELKTELHREHIRIRNNYRATGDKDVPNYGQLEQISRVTLVQRYLDQVNRILQRDQKVDAVDLKKHFDRQLLLPYILIDGLRDDSEAARLIERLPVASPLQIYAAPTRSYPFGSAAAHTLGYVRRDDEIDADGFPGEDLTTFKMKGTSGRDGLEKAFDAQLQGEAGGRIYRVDPAGYKINPPLEQRLPKKGKNIVTSLDIDLQLAAEAAIVEQEAGAGAAVALDIATGEVLVLASKPDYDLNEFSPRATTAFVAKIEEAGAWQNLALNAHYPPGSTFKLVVSIAGLRSGRLSPDDTSIDCQGVTMIGRSRKTCDNGLGHHGRLDLSGAIADSCDIYFYHRGIEIGPNVIAAEARRFHLDRPTGIELPGETTGMIIPDPAWKRATRNEPWTDGDTANMAIGQGDVQVTPLEMACFVASVARGEVFTQPTLLHDPHRPRQHTESIGLTPKQTAVLLAGMEGVVSHGTAAKFFKIPGMAIPGVRIAGKTGTAQYGNKLNIAWFICFAPADQPEIAVVAAIRSDVPGENFAGGRYGAAVANAVLKKYFDKKANPTKALTSPFKAE